MACASIPFTNPGNFAGTSFPEVGELEEGGLYLESEIGSEYIFEDIVGKSAALRKVLDQVASSRPPVNRPAARRDWYRQGTIARAIHNLSPRRERTFVRLNCAAIPSGLVESELFGHEKGLSPAP